MTTPRIEEQWQNKFLNKGTELGCGDLSIMIGTVSEILAKAEEEACQAGIDEARSQVLIELMSLPKISFPADKKLNGLYVEWSDINKLLNT